MARTEQNEPQRDDHPPEERPASKKEAPRPANVSLVDRAGNVQLKFLAREVRLSNGRVAAIKSGVATVRLSAGAGEIAVWGARSDEGPTAMITSEGYRKLNQVAGITVATPPSIEIAKLGRVANPYVETSETTGAFRAGWVRKIAIGPTPLGTMAICDRTTYLSLIEYYLEDLLGVAQRNPCACLWGVREADPASLLESAVRDVNEDIERRAKDEGKNWLKKYMVTPEEVKRAKSKAQDRLWAFLEVEPITGQGLWFDRTSAAIAKVMGTYVRTGKFGIRKLEAIAYRNVLSDHPLMPKKKISPDRLVQVTETVKDSRGKDEDVARDWYTDVTVYFHEQVEGRDEIEKVIREYDAGMRTGAAVVDASTKAERVSATDDAGEDDGDEVTREERDAERDQKKASAAKAPVERMDDEQEPPSAAESTKTAPAPAPDPRLALIASLKTVEEVAGKRMVGLLLPKFPGIQASRAKASIDELRAYQRALEAAINDRDNGS